MKKILALLLVFCMVLSVCAVSVSAEEEITVMLNGEKINFADQQPVIISDRTMVPFRAVAEALGGIVEWDSEYKVVYIACGKVGNVRIIGMQIGNPEIQIIDYKNSEQGVVNEESTVKTDIPAGIYGDRTMVPLRIISDIYGGETAWDGDTRTVSIAIDVSENVYPDDKACKDFMDNNFFKAKHILVMSGETRSDDEAKNLADDIMKEIESGADFDKLMLEKSEDPGSTQVPGGYVFTFGEMVEEFENAVASLKGGEITKEPVKSSYGYHIIKREALTEEDYAMYADQIRFYVLAYLAGLEVN